MTGNVNIMAVIIHQMEFFSLANFDFRLKITDTKESKALKKAIISAIKPLVKHPNTSTGINPLTKKIIVIIKGTMMCTTIRFI